MQNDVIGPCAVMHTRNTPLIVTTNLNRYAVHWPCNCSGVFFDVALSKMERKKFQKSLRLREEEEFRLVKEGRDGEIANLPEIYDPHWAFGQKPTYRHRMGKLLGLT